LKSTDVMEVTPIEAVPAREGFRATAALTDGSSLFAGYGADFTIASMSGQTVSLPAEFTGIASFALRPGREQMVTAKGAEIALYGLETGLAKPKKLNCIMLRLKGYGSLDKVVFSPSGNFLFVDNGPGHATHVFAITNRNPPSRLDELENSPNALQVTD